MRGRRQLLLAAAGVAALAGGAALLPAGADATFTDSTSATAGVKAAWFTYRSATISAVAGTGAQANSGDGGPATAAALNYPSAVTSDEAGNVYVCEAGGAGVRRIATDGTITTVFGSATTRSFSGDNGQASSATMDSPRGIASAGGGVFYVADTGNSRIRKVAADGVITTIAGTGTVGYGGDEGPATAADLDQPRGLALDPVRNVLYIADTNNSRVRALDLAGGTITTVAGTGTYGYAGDGGAATNAQLRSPFGLAVAPNGDLYVADRDGNTVRLVTHATGVITTVAGGGNAHADGVQATTAALSGPNDVVLDAYGSLYIAEGGGHRILKVDPDGVLHTLAGTAANGGSGDGGAATAATLQNPRGITINPVDGYLYVSDQNDERVRRLNP